MSFARRAIIRNAARSYTRVTATPVFSARSFATAADGALAKQGETQNCSQDLEDGPKDSYLYSLSQLSWKWWVPVAVATSVPVLGTEMIVLNEEVQMVGCFMLFVAGMNHFAAPLIQEMKSKSDEETLQQMELVQKAQLRQLRDAKNNSEKLLTLEEDFSNLWELRHNMDIVKAEVDANKQKVEFHEEAAKKLDSLVALEDAAVHALRQRMVSKVKAEVKSAFANDKKVKETALTRAIEYIEKGAKGPRGKDVVGEVFQQAIANYRDSYSKQSSEDPILTQLDKDVKALMAKK